VGHGDHEPPEAPPRGRTPLKHFLGRLIARLRRETRPDPAPSIHALYAAVLNIQSILDAISFAASHRGC
jgi:hypothetical protein